METLRQLDSDLFLYLNQMGTEQWDGFWLILTDQWMAFPLYGLLALLILWKSGFKSAVVSGFFIIASVVISYAISYAFKEGIARPRPCNVYNIYTEMRFPLKEVGKGCGTYGFVSSHATVAMAMITLIGLILRRYFKWIMIPLMTWVLLFGYSRIYVGKHYPGDIIVGFAVGLAVGVLVYKVRVWLEKRVGGVALI